MLLSMLLRSVIIWYVGVSVVDGNGDLVTALDNDLEKKLVVISNDLNLWYALLQSALKDEEINIETIPGRYVKF